jgi:hypothetical protein
VCGLNVCERPLLVDNPRTTSAFGNYKIEEKHGRCLTADYSARTAATGLNSHPNSLQVRNLPFFDLWDFERDGRIYERLGIRSFKRFASPRVYWNQRRGRSDPSLRIVRNFDSAIEWEARTRSNEFVHLCSLIVGLTIVVWLYLRGEYAWLGAMVFVVIVWDIYPIMLQRYNRAKIWRIKSSMRGMQKSRAK